VRYGEISLYARSLRGVADPRRREAIHEAVSSLVECFEQGVRPPVGLGLKKLRPPVWEIRSSLQDRILFGWNRDVVTFLVAGGHEDIKRFLKWV
jgi:hypothetical protein